MTVRSRPQLRSTTELPRTHLRRQVAELVARQRGVPSERVKVRHPADHDLADAGDFLITQRALTALGPPPNAPHTLYLVRSGPLLDPLVAPLAATVHTTGWLGDDVGISHLEEQGGMLVFDLLTWTIPADNGATVVVVDDPAYVDETTEYPTFAAVSLRLSAAGALCIRACGEGTPPTEEKAGYAHYFSGRGPCGAWLDFYAALDSAAINRGESTLLHTVGPKRQGWVLIDMIEPEQLRMNSVRL